MDPLVGLVATQQTLEREKYCEIRIEQRNRANARDVAPCVKVNINFCQKPTKCHHADS